MCLPSKQKDTLTFHFFALPFLDTVHMAAKSTGLRTHLVCALNLSFVSQVLNLTLSAPTYDTSNSPTAEEVWLLEKPM